MKNIRLPADWIFGPCRHSSFTVCSPQRCYVQANLESDGLKRHSTLCSLADGHPPVCHAQSKRSADSTGKWTPLDGRRVMNQDFARVNHRLSTAINEWQLNGVKRTLPNAFIRKLGTERHLVVLAPNYSREKCLGVLAALDTVARR